LKKKKVQAVKKSKPKTKKRRVTSFSTDRRRKHRHWQVTVYYRDSEKFARIYTDRGRATRFAERQKKSPVVRSARVRQVH
jgi:ribosomal protein L14E/L6E/L27E